MPFYPDGTGEGLKYDIETYWEHLVVEYTNMPMSAVLDLDVVDFMALRRDAYISELSKTEDGREYLDKCWCFEAEDADYSAVTEFMNMLGGA